MGVHDNARFSVDDPGHVLREVIRARSSITAWKEPITGLVGHKMAIRLKISADEAGRIPREIGLDRLPILDLGSWDRQRDGLCVAVPVPFEIAFNVEPREVATSHRTGQ